MDRNCFGLRPRCCSRVALREEGVDRNGVNEQWLRTGEGVALLAEGVDRNQTWARESKTTPTVALLAEGVDRNKLYRKILTASKCRPPRGGRG